MNKLRSVESVKNDLTSILESSIRHFNNEVRPINDRGNINYNLKILQDSISKLKDHMYTRMDVLLDVTDIQNHEIIRTFADELIEKFKPSIYVDEENE